MFGKCPLELDEKLIGHVTKPFAVDVALCLIRSVILNKIPELVELLDTLPTAILHLLELPMHQIYALGHVPSSLAEGSGSVVGVVAKQKIEVIVKEELAEGDVECNHCVEDSMGKFQIGNATVGPRVDIQ